MVAQKHLKVNTTKHIVRFASFSTYFCFGGRPLDTNQITTGPDMQDHLHPVLAVRSLQYVRQLQPDLRCHRGGKPVAFTIVHNISRFHICRL